MSDHHSEDKKAGQMELDPFAGEYEPEPFTNEPSASDEIISHHDDTPSASVTTTSEQPEEEPLFFDEPAEDRSILHEADEEAAIYASPAEPKSGLNIGMIAAVVVVAVAAIGYLSFSGDGEKSVQVAETETHAPAAMLSAPEAAKVEAAKVEAAKVEAAKAEAAKVEAAKIEATKIEATKSKSEQSAATTLAATGSGNWVIYLASATSHKSAQQMVARIKASNIETRAVQASVGGKVFHRIQLKRSLNREDAELTRTFLAKKLGLKGAWIAEQPL